MRTREKQYADYGLSDDRVKELMEYCRESDNLPVVVEAASFACPSLSGILVKSLVKKVGYWKLIYTDDVLCTKQDFYGYRRRTIAILDILLRGRELGLWVDGEAVGQIKPIIR